MSCFRPLRGIVVDVKNGKKRVKVVPYDYIENTHDYDRSETFPLPCGHCVGCRQDQAKEWSNRLLMESLYHEQCYFLTLTYNDSHAHWVDYTNTKTGQFWKKEDKHQATLQKSDCQMFMKRLRSEYEKWKKEWYFDSEKLEWKCDLRTRKQFDPSHKIRFYCAGEYGGHTYRPHMHLIIFGMCVPESEFIPCGKSETGEQYFVMPRLNDVWYDFVKDEKGELIFDKEGNPIKEPIGFHSIEPANEYTFKYCANYVTKKLGIHPNKFYEDQGLEPPFNLMSRMPGIGAQYLIDHPEIMDNDRIVIGTSNGKYEFAPPRYFKKSYKEVFPDRYSDHVDLSSRAADDRIVAIERKTGLCYTDYLKVPEQVAESKLNRRDKI